jgi:orotidine-5'-phosphate decarboxylase
VSTDGSFDPGNRVIAALDVPDSTAAVTLATRIGDAAGWVKVGLELFCADGPPVVAAMRSMGRRVMLDLKLHDIPETVARSVAQVAGLGAQLLTIHTAGGWKMMEAAAKAARGSGLKLLGVTVLTSLDENDLAQIGDGGSVEDLVRRRAQLAMECGLDGVVASPREAAVVRGGAPEGFYIVTPGIRPGGNSGDDQKRVATPAAAIAAGASHIVVGRPIRDAADPRAAAEAIVAELAAS